MDDETRAFLEAMEGRLMARMNDQHERIMASLTTLLIAFQADRYRLQRPWDAP
jgi:hypothetical protein